jgi:triosephosphate isomerase
MSRKILVAGNWKLNGDLSLAESLIPKVAKALLQKNNVECALFPAFVHLSEINKLAQPNGIVIGAQNVFEQEKGAYTGEVSLDMLQSISVKHVLLGHSERRSLFDESDELIYKKTCLAVEQGFHVTFCVGETLEERENGQTNAVVAKQLASVLATPAILEHITIAYEPVWAIGTGKTATPEQAQAVHAFIRQEIEKVAPQRSQSIQILYGGSVNSKNAAELFQQPDIDGGLVGGASLKVDEFLGIIECTN